MDTPDHPNEPTSGRSDDRSASKSQDSDRTRLERALTKSPLWKKRTLENIEKKRAANSDEPDVRSERRYARLSAQIAERNDEIKQLRQAVSKLENEKSQLDRAHREELELREAELERLQDAYDQFEKESDTMLTELEQRNGQLLDECMRRDSWSLLK